VKLLHTYDSSYRLILIRPTKQYQTTGLRPGRKALEPLIIPLDDYVQAVIQIDIVRDPQCQSHKL
jgi:hypothetical protein